MGDHFWREFQAGSHAHKGLVPLRPGWQFRVAQVWEGRGRMRSGDTGRDQIDHPFKGIVNVFL